MAQSWNSLARQYVVVGVIDTLLRGAGQVMLQNNPLTGLLFLAGILYNAIVTPALPVFWGALIGLACSTAVAMALRVDRAAIHTGLYGFNGILVGIALPTFLHWNGTLVGYIVLGGAISTIVMAALTHLFGNLGITPLTFPFVLAAWFLLLTVYFFTHVVPIGLSTPALPSAAGISATLRPNATNVIDAGLTFGNVIQAWFRGVAQVFLQDNLVTGIIFVIALLVNSPLAAGFALAGSAIGLGIALALGGDGYTVYHGMYGYNAVLCAIAVGSVFYVVNWKSAFYALVCALFGTIVTAALFSLFAPYAMPILTSAFVFTTWLFVLPKKTFWLLDHKARHAQYPGPPVSKEAT
jgi:urea transporter